jgi:hypothetical protein
VAWATTAAKATVAMAANANFFIEFFIFSP